MNGPDVWSMMDASMGGAKDGEFHRCNNLVADNRYGVDNERLIAAGLKIDVVFIGDSITAGWAFAGSAHFGGGRVNRGISGQTTPQILVRFSQDVLALRPRIVHIMAGTNDIAGNTGRMTLGQTVNNIRCMAEAAQADGLRVMIGSVLPARDFEWSPRISPAAAIAALNRRLAGYARSSGFWYVDYYKAMAAPDGGMLPELSFDGVHPNESGYNLMSSVAEPALRDASVN